jgi:hypothetical protein
VARIRSIKPEFWKSETIAALPIRTRLTFIGLWSYVDDNGVGIDSFKLISAELYGLEDDPREARDNTRECLARLADARLITRYTLDGKRYIRITNWDEHQRIDRPNKPRYPLPTDPTVTLLDPDQAADMDNGATVSIDHSRNPRATLATVHRLEQWNRGAGEQGNRGTEEDTHSSADATETLFPDVPPPPPPPPPAKGRRSKKPTDPESNADFMAWWRIYPNPQKRPDTFRAWLNATAKVTASELLELTTAYAEAEKQRGTEQRFIPHSSTWLNQERWRDALPKVERATGANGHRPYMNPTDASGYYGEL